MAAELKIVDRVSKAQDTDQMQTGVLLGKCPAATIKAE
jgi:hypothetical protein